VKLPFSDIARLKGVCRQFRDLLRGAHFQSAMVERERESFNSEHNDVATYMEQFLPIRPPTSST
jgi:hypothetical protein